MPKLSSHFYELYKNPEEVKARIRRAYKQGGTMQKAAELMGLSVAQLRVHCRQLGFDPVQEKKNGTSMRKGHS